MSNQSGNGALFRTENDKLTSQIKDRLGALITGEDSVAAFKPALRSTALIGLSFLLTSTGWLSWEYHLLDQIPAGRADFCTMVIGYLLQAAGIAIYARFLYKKPGTSEYLMPAALILHMLCMFPAVLSPFIAGTLLFGFLMNVFCGVIAGYYLCDLMKGVDRERRASVFGVGYAAAILASWLLSVVDGGRVYYSEKVLFICLAITAAAFWVAGVRISRPEVRTAESAGVTGKNDGARAKPPERSFIYMAGALVLLFSIVNGSGFAFPSADLGGAVNVELSRLVYAIGLVLAGHVTNKNRKYGAICALTALVIPFIILSLRGGTFSAVLFWALSYFTFGFYSVYRVILFSDIASDTGIMPLACFGLMIGRVGDAVGEVICILFENNLAVIVSLTGVLFASAVAVFFKLYQGLYVPESTRQKTEKERFMQFVAEHDLSPREQDVMHRILENMTVSEIADSLSISENTVKYHVRNILQKTGCRSRKELITVYAER